MARGDEVDVRPLCESRDLGNMGVFWQYIRVTVSDVEMVPISKGSCLDEWGNSSSLTVYPVGYFHSLFCGVNGMKNINPVITFHSRLHSCLKLHF